MERLQGLTGTAIDRPRTVAEQVADLLREAIAQGTLAAGSVLRQDELAARLGFSRMPIRDALRQLEAEGLVTIHPTRGAFVARMEVREIREIYALRALLEAEALRLSCPLLGAAALAEAAAVLERLEREPEVGRWGQLNRRFHLTLYGACGNGRLLDLIEAQHRAADRYVRVLLSTLDYRAPSEAERKVSRSMAKNSSSFSSTSTLRGRLLFSFTASRTIGIHGVT